MKPGLELSAEPSATIRNRPGGAGRREISIEGLLGWAYRVQMVWELAGAYGRSSGPAGHGRSHAEIVRLTGMLGARVDNGPALWAMPDQVHDDALAVHAAVTGLGRARSGPVILHARAGTRPELDAGPVIALEPARWKDRGQGREEPVYEYHSAWRGGKQPWFCRLRIIDRAPEIAASRGAWREWRESLAMLAGHFRTASGELTRWAVTEAMPPEAPWLDAEAQNLVGGLDAAEKP